ncbi:MAG: hypothetical protein RL653_904 [Pseudomonadota bacterium]|jgi:diadenosine tetraphosphate (Ap4A) HIT family hydrolase
MSPDCPACEIVRGNRSPTGGVLLREQGFVLHAVDGPTPVPGWMVLTAERCTRAVYTLDEVELTALLPLAARIMRLQRERLGAEHVYLFAIGDVLRHCHVHLVPRYADTPGHLRGRGVFDARPEEQLPPEAVAAACRTLQAGLGLTAPSDPR